LIKKGYVKAKWERRGLRFYHYEAVDEKDLELYLSRVRRNGKKKFDPFRLISDEEFECNLRRMLLESDTFLRSDLENITDEGDNYE